MVSAGVFTVLSQQPGSWPAILSSAGHAPGTAQNADIVVIPPGTPAGADWQKRVQLGSALILEGSSPLAASFGFRQSAKAETIPLIHIVDVHQPELPVIWDKAVEIPRYEVPPEAQVFATDRWTKAPVVAGYKTGSGAVLWIATTPGKTGYERFPWLMQSLADLGFGPSFRTSKLWAFFDYSYRSRADVDYLAVRWRAAGIAALHVASWHFYDADAGRDEYLKQLIEACHRHGVLVYAWIELPHVSEKFWADHPQWREKTGALQDAQLDWRKLMNLQNAECAAAVRDGLQAMMSRFDWDGVNLAELYFESLEGAGNPSRFTPMNDNVRSAFRKEAGWDPVSIWSSRNDGPSLRQFLDYRAELARKLQEEWLGVAESLRSTHPDIDIVLTHVDDRFDTGMRDAIGADASRVLPLLDSHSFSFLIEDPATVWNLGPERYPEIAKRYRPLTNRTEKLAIDINIVDRYQDVYPTKQQAGTELLQLVHMASGAFARVALYFENSLLKPDLELLPAAAAVVTRYEKDKQKVSADSPMDVEFTWSAADALVDGKPWPMLNRGRVRLPAGAHVIEPGMARDGLKIADLNATLRRAGVEGKRVTFEYSSDSRAIVRFDRKPGRVEVDGVTLAASCLSGSDCALLLPRGDHRVSAN
jgi:hypothetical protein